MIKIRPIRANKTQFLIELSVTVSDTNEETVREDVYNNLRHKKRGCLTTGVNVKEWGEKLDSGHNIQVLPEPFSYKASRFPLFGSLG